MLGAEPSAEYLHNIGNLVSRRALLGPMLGRIDPTHPITAGGTDVYSAQRLKISDPLVPPKPKEFDSAMLIFALRE